MRQLKNLKHILTVYLTQQGLISPSQDLLNGEHNPALLQLNDRFIETSAVQHLISDVEAAQMNLESTTGQVDLDLQTLQNEIYTFPTDDETDEPFET